MEEDAGNVRGREKALIAKLEAEKKMRQMLEAQQIDQASKLLLKDKMHVTWQNIVNSGPFYLQIKFCLARNLSFIF